MAALWTFEYPPKLSNSLIPINPFRISERLILTWFITSQLWGRTGYLESKNLINLQGRLMSLQKKTGGRGQKERIRIVGYFPSTLTSTKTRRWMSVRLSAGLFEIQSFRFLFILVISGHRFLFSILLCLFLAVRPFIILADWMLTLNCCNYFIVFLVCKFICPYFLWI